MKKVFCNLKEVMAGRGYNIKKLQEETSLSRTTISNLINHYTAGIQFETLALLCDTLNCNPEDLLKLHEFDVSFEEKDVSFMELEKDNEATRNLLQVTIECKVLLDSKKYDVEFDLECDFVYFTDPNLDYDINEIVPSILFKNFITDNDFPDYIRDYITKSLDNIVHDIIFSTDLNNK